MKLSLFDIENIPEEEFISSEDKNINVLRLEYALNLGNRLKYYPLYPPYRQNMVFFLKMSTEELLTCNRATQIPLDLTKYDRLLVVYILYSHLKTKESSDNFPLYYDESYQEYLRSLPLDILVELDNVINKKFYQNTLKVLPLDLKVYRLPEVSKVLWEFYYNDITQGTSLIENPCTQLKVKYSYILKLSQKNVILYNKILGKWRYFRELYSLTWTSIMIELENNIELSKKSFIDKDIGEFKYESFYSQERLENYTKIQILWLIIKKRYITFSQKCNIQDRFYVITQHDLNKSLKSIIVGLMSLNLKLDKPLWIILSECLKNINTKDFSVYGIKNTKELVTIGRRLDIANLCYLSHIKDEITIISSTMFMLKFINGVC